MVTQQLFMSTVFVAGVLSFFSPCIIPILPVYIGILAGDGKEGKHNGLAMKLIRTFTFILGISTSFVILGFGAGALGSLINSKGFLIGAGVIVIILGIHQTGLIHIRLLDREKKLHLKRKDNEGYGAPKAMSFPGIYILGFTFSFGWTPCIGPILGAVLGVAAAGGQTFYGAWLMLLYAAGLAIPFMAIAAFSNVLLSKVGKLNRHMGKFKIIGGILIILMGILLMTGNLNDLTAVFERLVN